MTDKQEQHSDEWKLFCACRVFSKRCSECERLRPPPARLHLAWPELEKPDATAGIWVITKGRSGRNLWERFALHVVIKSSKQLQKMWDLSAPTLRPHSLLEEWQMWKKRIEKGKRRSRTECRALKNPSLMLPQERSGREQTKVSKTSKGAFF